MAVTSILNNTPIKKYWIRAKINYIITEQWLHSHSSNSLKKILKLLTVYTSNGRPKTAWYTNSTCCRQHFCISRLILQNKKVKVQIQLFCDAKHANNAYFLIVENIVLTVYIPLNDATNFPMDRATMLAIWTKGPCGYKGQESSYHNIQKKNSVCFPSLLTNKLKFCAVYHSLSLTSFPIGILLPSAVRRPT